MSSLDRKIRFAETHITSPDGEPFSLAGRDWVLRELWRPLDGWKLWPVDKARLCKSCSARANTIVDDFRAADSTRAKKHVAECSGLTAEPLLIVAAHLKRQSGKTMNVAAWALARAFQDEQESIALLAGSEDQVARLYGKHYLRVVCENAKLATRAVCRGTRISVPGKHSDIELLPTSMSSIGDTRTVVVLDECRVVPAQVAMAMLPTLFARSGWQCPQWHVRTHAGVDDDNAPRTCPVCDARTQPWYGKALLLSSAGELTDTEQDWFHEFCDFYSANPHPNVHVFRSIETLNPKVSRKVSSVIGEVFGAIESTRIYAGIENTNEPMRKGQPYLGPADIRRATDARLRNVESLATRCVGFLDTSSVVEKTSLVLLADDLDAPRGISALDAVPPSPWEYVYQARLDFWEPAKLPGRVIDEKVVEAHVVNVLTMFTGLVEFWIDTRGMPWAVAMCRRLMVRFGFVRAWTSNDARDTDAGWRALEQRILARPRPTIRLQQCEAQVKEFAGLRLRQGAKDSSPTVVDRDRRKSHADITAALAVCCYRIAVLQLKGTSSTLTSVAKRLAAVRVPERRHGVARASRFGVDSL